MYSNVIDLKGGRFQEVGPRAPITLATPLAGGDPGTAHQSALSFGMRTRPSQLLQPVSDAHP